MSFLVIFNMTLIPVIQEAFREAEALPHLVHYCNCGCNGDISKCTCDEEAGLIGFTHCASRMHSIVPVVMDLTAKLMFLENLLLIPDKQTLIRPKNDFLSIPVLQRDIYHPPE
ncbi:MAG: hypothetical protein AB7T22_06375 [Calditrichaceae bacterium]